MLLTYVYNADNTVLKTLNKIYARLLLDHAPVIYSPHYLQMIIIIKKVQKNLLSN